MGAHERWRDLLTTSVSAPPSDLDYFVTGQEKLRNWESVTWPVLGPDQVLVTNVLRDTAHSISC